ncbi:MAG: hypothetical protein HOV80_21090 [Polyangiaceae bacterium]|nr:hypothetical protein [Polyangiaceae bacterium]
MAGSSPPQPPTSVRSVEIQTPNAEPAPPQSVRPEPPAATAGAAIEDAPSVALHHSRGHERTKFGWLRIALPIFGLLVVPSFGLIYAATATFGKSAEGETGADEEVVGADGGRSKRKPKGKSTGAGKGTTKPRSDGAASCCEKLRELGKTAPIDARATYLSAAQACEAAPDEDRAFRIARSNVQTAKHEVPDECNP